MAIDYNKKMQFPTSDDFVNRIILVEHTENKAGSNINLVLTLEVVSPEVVNIGDEDVNIAGVETISYYGTTAFEKDGTINTEETQKKRKRLRELYDNLGLSDAFKAMDFENPDLTVLKNLVVLTAMGCEMEEMLKSPSKEQLSKGIKHGGVMKHPVTGKAMVFYKPKIMEIFCVAPAGVAGATTGNKPY